MKEKLSKQLNEVSQKLSETKCKFSAKGAALGAAVALPVMTFAAEGGATSALDLSGVDFSIVVGTVSAVIGVGIVPMLTIAAAKKGVSLLQSLVKKA